jgi:uncharacterized SAM-dependent methyltransferase
VLIRGGVRLINSFAEDVRDGLGRSDQKQLPSKYFYDEIGSALFEVITRLPEYGMTRAEERILQRYSYEITDQIASHSIVVELGRQPIVPLKSLPRLWRAASANSMIWPRSVLWDMKASTWMV